jgi:peptide/nickel transport system permease protein
MHYYLIRRVLWMIPTFFGITLICFLTLRMADTDPVTANFGAALQGRQISAEAIEHLRRIYDLDKPWYVQYAKLIARLVTFDLGNRWMDGRPIIDVIGEALPVTMLLSLLSMFLAYLIAIPLGVFSAVKQYSRLDRAVTIVLFVLYSIPSFWFGTMCIVFLASGHFIDCGFTKEPGCFPLQGIHAFEGFDQMSFGRKVLDVAWHLILPVLTLTYMQFAAVSRYMRSGMLETLRQDFIRTARAKGASERAVIFGHALRNSVIPIITLLGLTLPELISGSVIVESIFGIRGMGLVALEAIRMPDYPLVITIVAFSAVLTMIGVLISDVLYAVVDPRIRHGEPGDR